MVHNIRRLFSPGAAAVVLLGLLPMLTAGTCDPTCEPSTCGNAQCGLVDDGCGYELDCGSCAPGEQCDQNNQCTCQPETCTSAGAECGTIDDGCGGTVACQDSCTGVDICQDNRCVCQAKTCIDSGAECGSMDDGCGNTLQCPNTCSSTDTCQNNRCHCQPETCIGSGAECGSMDDGCGNTLQCPNTCSGGDTCQNNVCTCVPQTCASLGAECGPVDDGCGTSLACGDPCANGKVCDAGFCVDNTFLTLHSGDAQSALLNAEVSAPVILTVTDSDGNLLSGIEVSISAPPGAAVTPATASSDSSGLVAFFPRVGRAAGLYQYTAAVGSSSQVFEATAVLPPSDTVVPLVNVQQVLGASGVPGPGSLAQLDTIRGLVAASNGTIHFTAHHRIYRLLPSGALDIIAGQATAGSPGAPQPAVEASLNHPSGLALDRAAQVLYVADMHNNQVRKIDLTTGTISTVAGGATYGATGDGGLASSALLYRPQSLSLNTTTGDLWVNDSGNRRIRKIETGIAGLIDTEYDYSATSHCASVDEVTLTGYTGVAPMAWDAAGNLFVAGQIACGDSGFLGNGYSSGILRFDASGVSDRVGGKLNGSTTDGAPATAYHFGSVDGAIASMAFDPDDNLWLAMADHRVLKLDSISGVVTTMVGDATAGGQGDWDLRGNTRLDAPTVLAFTDDGQLLVGDAGNGALRTVWDISGVQASHTQMSLAGGDAQQVLVDQLMSPFMVVVSDTAGIAGVDVVFSTLGPGAALLNHLAVTDGSGVAAAVGRPGLQVGAHSYQASAIDIHGAQLPGSPVTFTVTANAPAPLTAFTAVNTDQTAGFDEVDGPATLARVEEPRGVAISSSSSVYFTADHAIYHLHPDGFLELLGGSTVLGNSGDLGHVSQATFYKPSGLVLDEVNQVLFVADTLNDRVRRIDLTTGIITHYAGDGSQGAPDYGDGGDAAVADLDNPKHLSLAPDGALIVNDASHWKIRRIDPQSPHTITSLIDYRDNGACQPAGSIPVRLSSYSTDIAMAWNQNGDLYLGGQIACGDSDYIGNGFLVGIVKLDTNGAFHHIAGKYQGATGDNIPAAGAFLGHNNTGNTTIKGMAFDAGGNLLFSHGHRLRMIDTAGQLTTVAGTETAGSGGDYQSGANVLLDTPGEVQLTPAGHIVVADTQNHAIRFLW